MSTDTNASADQTTTYSVSEGTLLVDLAGKLTKMLPPPADALAAFTIDALFPPANPFDQLWSGLAPLIQNIVAEQLVKQTVDTAGTDIKKYLDKLSTKKLTAQPSAYAKQQLYDFLNDATGVEAGTLFSAVETLKYANTTSLGQDSSTFKKFVAGASIYLANLQSMVNLQFHVGTDTQSLLQMIAEYRGYLSLAFNRMVNERINMVTLTTLTYERNVNPGRAPMMEPYCGGYNVTDTATNTTRAFPAADPGYAQAQTYQQYTQMAVMNDLVSSSLVPACLPSDMAWAQLGFVYALSLPGQNTFSIPITNYNQPVTLFQPALAGQVGGYHGDYNQVTIGNIRSYNMEVLYFTVQGTTVSTDLIDGNVSNIDYCISAPTTFSFDPAQGLTLEFILPQSTPSGTLANVIIDVTLSKTT